MAEPVRVQLVPVDVAKDIPQWGRVKTPATPTTPEVIEWTTLRMADSSRFRETYGGFENGSVYEIEINIPGYPEPFTSTATGEQLNMGNPNSERQSNYPFANIGQLPLFFMLMPDAPPLPTP